jgi:hypothetical protein
MDNSNEKREPKDVDESNEEERKENNMNNMIERSKSGFKNEKGLLIVFSPIILFTLVFFVVDSYSDYENFQNAYNYFKDLYSNRLIIFAGIIFGWSYAKKYVSGYILLLITYLFNILIVFSDIYNINNFVLEYKESQSDSMFYKNLMIKNTVNLFFLITWILLLIVNLYKWFRVYKMAQRIDVEVSDGPVAHNAHVKKD